MIYLYAMLHLQLQFITLGVIMRRRELLRAGIAGVAACAACRVVDATAQGLPSYCSMDPSTQLSLYGARSSTGSRRLDRALISELRSIMRVMPVNPGFRIIDDLSGPNAFAISRSLIQDTDGTVVFGINLINNEMNGHFGGYAVAGIAAHECAHIFQYFSPWGARLASRATTNKPLELHADYLAGYYLGKDKAGERDVRVFANSLYSKGDYAFNSRDHHGTPEERVDAMQEGYAAALRGESFTDAAEAAADYVS